MGSDNRFKPTKEFPGQEKAPHEWPPQQGQDKGIDKSKKPASLGDINALEFPLCSWSYPAGSMAAATGQYHFPIPTNLKVTRIECAASTHGAAALTIDLQNESAVGTVDHSVTTGTATVLASSAKSGNILLVPNDPKAKAAKSTFLRLDIIAIGGTPTWVVVCVWAQRL